MLPCMFRPSSDATNANSPAMSSGSAPPRKPMIGCSRSMSTLSGMWKFRVSPVVTKPGAIAFTRIFVFENSIAIERVSWTTAPLVIE